MLNKKTTKKFQNRRKGYAMQNLISNTLGSNSFVILNKAVIKALGMHEAVALGFLIDKWAYFQHADFYYTIQDLSNDTDLSERECRNIMRKLVDKGILIKRSFEGIPPKQYYNINQNAIIDILKNPMPKKENPTLENPTKDLTLADSNPFKSDTFNPCKNDRVNTCKNDSDIYNNNKVSNNKVSNNKDKEKNIKKEKNAESLFDSFDFESENTDSSLKAKDKQDDLESLENEFKQIWDMYPKKQDKQSALNSYLKARKGAKIAKNSKGNPQSFETILIGVKNYLRANRGNELKFIKHLSTFLNQATYLDFQCEVNLNKRVGVIDDHADYVNADKSKYIPK